MKTPHLVLQCDPSLVFWSGKGFDPITLMSSLFKSVGIENGSQSCSLFFDDVLTIVVSYPKNSERADPNSMLTRKLVELLPLLFALGQGNNIYLLNKLLETQILRTTARFHFTQNS